MFHLQTVTVHKSFPPPCAVNIDHNRCPFSLLSQQNPTSNSTFSTPYPSDFILNFHLHPSCAVKSFSCLAVSRKSDADSSNEPNSKPKAECKTRLQQRAAEASQNEVENPGRSFPSTIPRKPRRGRKSEAVACEDFIRDSLDRTFESIRQQNPELFANKEKVIKERIDDTVDENIDEDDDGVKDGGGRKNKMVVEEESADWPLDADVGWGVRASEFFDQYPIKNVVGEDGFEIDWEGELDDSWVKEINCLEWESFAFHPSPLIVLVFERYKR